MIGGNELGRKERRSTGASPNQKAILGVDGHKRHIFERTAAVPSTGRGWIQHCAPFSQTTNPTTTKPATNGAHECCVMINTGQLHIVPQPWNPFGVKCHGA